MIDVDTLGAVAACLNCDDQPGAPPNLLFCSRGCKEIASAVRYARGARADGRERHPEVAEAIRIRIGIAVGGGYDDSRGLSQEERATIIERDGGICRKCGEPGAEVDHISWAAVEPNDPGNLQLLCSSCHREKTLSAMRPANAKQRTVIAGILARIDATVPMRPCDDPRYAAAWRGIASRRKAAAAAE